MVLREEKSDMTRFIEFDVDEAKTIHFLYEASDFGRQQKR